MLVKTHAFIKACLFKKNMLFTKFNGEHDFENDEMKTVFENGKLLIDYSWEDVKKRAAVTVDML